MANAAIFVRQARETDLEGVVKVNHLSLKTEISNGLIQKRATADFEYLLGLAKYFVIAECNKEIVGYTIVLDESTPFLENEIFSFYPKHYKGFVFIEQVAVDPAYRRKGVAKQMYDFFLSREQKKVLADFLVKPRNGESIAFHESIGFKSLGDFIHLKSGLVAEVYAYKKP